MHRGHRCRSENSRRARCKRNSGFSRPSTFCWWKSDVDAGQRARHGEESGAERTDFKLEPDDLDVRLLRRGVEFIHAAELHALVERSGDEAARVDARLAGPKRQV